LATKLSRGTKFGSQAKSGLGGPLFGRTTFGVTVHSCMRICGAKLSAIIKVDTISRVETQSVFVF